MGSPGSHSQLVSCSVGITCRCSVLAFLLSISLTPSHLHCLCSPYLELITVLGYSHSSYISTQSSP